VRINMGVAKSHSVTRMTLALKHMMGFLETPSSLHTNIHKGIADLNTKSRIKADLHILEALYIRMAFGDYVTCAGPETAEKNPAIVKRMNQIIAGVDPVLVDAYACSTFYHVKPAEFAHLKNAFDWGVGDMNVQAAQVSGKFVIVNTGAIAETVEPTPAQPTTPAQEIASKPEVTPDQPKAIPLPDMAEPAASVQPAAAGTICEAAINPNDLLNKALIPASVILAGAGLAVTRKKAGKQPSSTEKKPEDE